jgi:hypothetical protein
MQQQTLTNQCSSATPADNDGAGFETRNGAKTKAQNN